MSAEEKLALKIYDGKIPGHVEVMTMREARAEARRRLCANPHYKAR